MGFPVELRVYDLSRGMAKQLSTALLGKQFDGIWHTGVHVYGKEYFYGGGIQAMHPSQVVARYGMQPVEVVPLGTTDIPQERFEAFLREINHRFTAATYDLLNNNCNNFSNELANFLLGKSIPQHIIDLPNEALSTPLGAMLRPAIENMQREMQATGNQPFAIPFNNPALATAPVVAPTTSTPVTHRFMISAKPTLRLKPIVKRAEEINKIEKILSSEQVDALGALPCIVSDDVNLSGFGSAAITVQHWQALRTLLAQGAASPFLFPALGIFRVLLLVPIKSDDVLQVKHECFDHLVTIADSKTKLSDPQLVMVLSVLSNAFANPVASDLVLSRAVQFLPFVFRTLTESSHPDVCHLSAVLISNCCLALQIEEEMVITTIVCGAVEVLDRLTRKQPSSQHKTIAGVVKGVSQLLRNFQAARSLSVELGLAEVLRRLHVTPGLTSLQPLLAEAVALI
ncbi:TPA: hypothetical protein N0F65_004634 [Lagenidium giganteum]|uniref:PPPDE domain-containing protein n=1 Tax=Lagenidium giganteum TaxID=4803 RepID=A0AAV2ZDD6_9STRA|nr:TPA: hypothetical protein N0F65_004634 [Lagenidium giganteum]